MNGKQSMHEALFAEFTNTLKTIDGYEIPLHIQKKGQVMLKIYIKPVLMEPINQGL